MGSARCLRCGQAIEGRDIHATIEECYRLTGDALVRSQGETARERERAEKAEAEVERVRAILHTELFLEDKCGERHTADCIEDEIHVGGHGPDDCTERCKRVRAALAPAPVADAPAGGASIPCPYPPGECPGCGSAPAAPKPVPCPGIPQIFEDPDHCPGCAGKAPPRKEERR